MKTLPRFPGEPGRTKAKDRLGQHSELRFMSQILRLCSCLMHTFLSAWLVYHNITDACLFHSLYLMTMFEQIAVLSKSDLRLCCSLVKTCLWRVNNVKGSTGQGHTEEPLRRASLRELTSWHEEASESAISAHGRFQIVPSTTSFICSRERSGGSLLFSRTPHVKKKKNTYTHTHTHTHRLSRWC